jgi:hypothetical protein
MSTSHSLMLADLKRSDLSAKDAERLHVQDLSPAETRALSGKAVASYRFPYFDEAGELTEFYRLRYLGQVYQFGTNKLLRYWQEGDTDPFAYLTPGVPWKKIFNDTGTPLLFTEGEKKAAAATLKHDLLTIALGGVWSFQSKKKHIEFLPQLEEIEYPGRLVEIVYDGDAKTNSDVRAARNRLASQLVERGAEVIVVKPPLGKSLDDVLKDGGLEAYNRLPRERVDAKTQIIFVRTRKIAAREKKERVAAITLSDIESRGSLHIADDEPLLFDRDERRLLSLLDHKSPQLGAYVADRYGINPSEDEWRFVYEHLRARTLRHGSPAETPLFAAYDAQQAALSLYCGDNAVFSVSAKGFEIVGNGHGGNMFRGFAVEPVKPAKRASEAAFRNVLGLPNFRGGKSLTREQQELLYELNFWSLLFPNLMRTRPHLLLDAVKGSGKTTGARAIGTALFGRRFDVQAVDRSDNDSVVTALINSPLVVLDNLDGNVPGLANILAVASTGGRIVRRVLYTTMQKIEFPLRGRIIATARQPDSFARDDVRDRTIVLSLERLREFRAESDIIDKVLLQRPAFWAHILSRLPEIIKAISNHKATPLQHRLADFAQFSLAIGPALGYSKSQVAEAMDALNQERDAFASERSEILRALQDWTATQISNGLEREELGCKKLSTSQLFTVVERAWTGSRPFPFKRPDTFGLALKNDESMLRDFYLTSRETGHARQSFYTITPMVDALPDSADGGEDE